VPRQDGFDAWYRQWDDQVVIRSESAGRKTGAMASAANSESDEEIAEARGIRAGYCHLRILRT
jgi:hypothetical protein